MTNTMTPSAPARGSVIKGSGMLILARVVGMVGGFALFLLLTWRSREATGIFRTAITYFVIMDTLPLLGMHRWVAAEISRERNREAEIFWMSVGFALVIALLSAGAYFAIAASGIYQPGVSDSLKIVALSTMPSALNLCVTTALVGLGCSHVSGVIGLVETLVRTGIAIALVALNVNVIWIVVVFTAVRLAAAGGGIFIVRSHLPRARLRWDRGLVKLFLNQVPNLAISMIGFLLIRSTAMILLPWLRSESEAGVYAAPFQLFDLLLLVPTVLTISTNFVFVESAKKSVSRLRRSTNELLFITAMYVFPLAVMACILAQPGIEFLFGPSYAASTVPLQLLMAAAAVTSLDQVLSTAMVNAGEYRSDRICIGAGAIVTVAATLLLTKPFGAAGAAAGLLAGVGCTLGFRLRLMGTLLNLSSFMTVLRRQAWPTLSAGLVVWLTLSVLHATPLANRTVAILLPSLVGVGSVLLFYVYGGLSPRHLRRIKTFMAQRG